MIPPEPLNGYTMLDTNCQMELLTLLRELRELREEQRAAKGAEGATA